MSDDGYKKNYGLIDRLREMSGLYKLGFEPESLMGLILPFGIVIVVGGLLGLVISRL